MNLPLATKILAGGALATVGTGGTYLLIKNKLSGEISQNDSKLKDLTFLPEDCRNSSSTNTCDLTFKDLKKIEFTFSDTDKKTPTIDGNNNDSGQAATLNWDIDESASFPSNLSFTIIPKNSEINLKKGSDDNDKINIPTTIGTRFQLEESGGKYYFKKSKLTSWDNELIKKIKGLQKFTTVSTATPTTTATSTDSQIKLSLTTTKTTSETPSTSKFEFKVEVSNPSAEAEIVSGVKVWECIIQGTKDSTDKELFADDAGKTDQISQLKKSFGMDQVSTGEKTLEEKHRNSIVKFITQCANTSSNIPSPDSSAKKLARTITKTMEDVTDQTNKLKFQNFEEFFIKEQS